ncbi:MAG TPA: HAMP domain-containing protein, partial [Anaerolineae bacterium]|nr:HAMP domain-containing protein [Anaerolineae bacterium]
EILKLLYRGADILILDEPTAVLGLLAGILRAGTITHNLLEPFALAFQAALVAYLLRQEYRGRLAWLFRQPLVALPVAVTLLQPMVLLSTFVPAYRPEGALAALDYAFTQLLVTAQLGLTESAFYGLFFQLIYLVAPQARPVVVARRPPPYGRTLNRRLQSLFIPLFTLMIAVLVYAVGATAIDIATGQAVDAMLRDATNGAEGMWQFISTGQSLIRQFAGEPELWSGDEEVCRARLQSSLQMLPYFSRLTAYDGEGEVLCTYPEPTPGETGPTPEEDELLEVVRETGGLQATRVHRGPDGRVILSFLSPLEKPGGGERHGVLVGRVEIDLNPLLEQVLTGLQWTMRRGEGFVVDVEGRIVVHPDPVRLLEPWELDQSRLPLETLPEGRGWVRESRDSRTNARQLACYVAVEGYPWAVVVLLPHEVVLGLATRIAAPLLLLLTALTGAVGVVIPLATSQLTRPLNLLARAAERIAQGDLEQPIRVAGDDEMAQVGKAFEKMRVGLKGRLEDLSLLLQVAQEVSATLDIAQGGPRILEGALQATGALVSRIVLLSATGDPQVVIGRGETVQGLGTLDRALALAARDVDHPLLIENLRRARTLAESGPLPEEIQAVVALPVHSKGRPVAVMWAGFSDPVRFEPSEVDLLSTLASQTAVLVENARLFQVAEGGRRRLAAILSSTGDAILVTDRDDRLLLVNPAAERALGLRADELVGRRVEETVLEPDLARILIEPLGRAGSLVEEVPLPGGRTFYASAATILSADGENIGRVVVMRDITHFKELDEMKSEFVATVSHDLRAPLTFMRGYATMLPMVGELNEKQREYLDKILVGIEKMGALIEDLLNLGRIEAGVGLEEKPCHLGAIVVEAVDGMRARAAARGLVLRLEPAEPAPIILGDATLLRQAVANLVDNAIKYTPSGGSVTVGLKAVGREVLITVADTGLGIAPEDQVRLFEKFYRIRRRDADEIQGSGLGLAIVKSIVERHGGRVWVESALNQGSTFTIALPIRTPPPEEEG